MPHAWWIALLLAVTLIWIATDRRVERVQAISDIPTWSVKEPVRDELSPTGFDQGQRQLIVPGHHNPSFWWIIESQLAAENGQLRLREIEYDSVPEGRTINRTSPYRWWLTFVGWSYGAVTGNSIGYSIEQGSLYADPVLLGILIVLGTLYTARFTGNFAALGFVVACICIYPLSANFQPGAPDSHSLSWVLALGSLLPLLVSKERLQTSGWPHFAIAGFCGGLAFWTNAPSQAPVLLAIFLGGLAFEFIRSNKASPEDPSPINWRVWAIVGATTTLLASMFEFAPDHFSWSLDAVHPIYAIAWLGMGELIALAASIFRKGRESLNGKTILLLVLALAAIATWPAVAAIKDTGSLLASDFYARELANHPSGGLAANLGVWLSNAEGFGAKWATLTPCFIFLLVLARILMSPVSRDEMAKLTLVLTAGLVAMILAFSQIRWWNLVDAITLAAVALFFASAEIRGKVERLWPVLASLCLLPGFFVGFPEKLKGEPVDSLSEPEIQALVERDFAYWIKKRAGDEPVVLFSTPIFSSGANYYGGIDVITSSDDKNQDGMLAAVRIASATTEQEVSILLNSRGVTHLALPLWDPMLVQLVRIGLQTPPNQPLPPNAFITSILEWDVPPWLRILNYGGSNEAAYAGHEIYSFALGTEQPPELGLSRLADILVEQGEIPNMLLSLRKALEAYPRSVSAIGATASIDFALRNREKLEETLETLTPYLSRRSARNLPADRRVSIAALFMQTQRTELAKEQIEEAMKKIDDATLKAMTPRSVALLIALSRNLDVPFPREETKQLALELVPTAIQERLSE